VHFLVCYLNKLQNVRCNDKDSSFMFLSLGTFNEVACMLTKQISLLGILHSGFIRQKPKLISDQS